MKGKFQNAQYMIMYERQIEANVRVTVQDREREKNVITQTKIFYIGTLKCTQLSHREGNFYSQSANVETTIA